MPGMIYGGSQAGSSGGQYGGQFGSSYGVDLPTTALGWFIDDLVIDRLRGTHPNLTRGAEATFVARMTGAEGKDPQERYEQLRNRLKYSHAVVNKTLLDGTPKFKEQHNQGDGHLVARFRPGSETESTQGFWGLLMGYSDETVRPSRQVVMELEVRILADDSEYENTSAVVDDLGIS